MHDRRERHRFVVRFRTALPAVVDSSPVVVTPFEAIVQGAP
jgi:hypothetical protein